MPRAIVFNGDGLLDGLDINQIPLRNIIVLPGGGVDLSLARSMINDGEVPTAELAGESFPLERFDAVRVSLEVA
ncbi:hypothetical protein MXD62_29240 [Frankia sp. Mgl5]|uniref:hypothetical protein n=1 Tax=Frankia sp. Mgl5 TaxID=2933793 RepID=UPI0020102926|nr:hypothetical protein [Frankia sp. Mgl5]MCK9931177.1 hypothetical protein [Frankia sp. Mgl5]